MQEANNIFYFFCLTLLLLSVIGIFCQLFITLGAKKLFLANTLASKKTTEALIGLKESFDDYAKSKRGAEFGAELKSEGMRTRLNQNPSDTDKPTSKYRELIDQAYSGRSAKDLSEEHQGVSRSEAQALVSLTSKIRAAAENDKRGSTPKVSGQSF